MQALRQHHLKNISGPDIFLGLLNVRDILFLGKVGMNLAQLDILWYAAAVDVLLRPFLLQLLGEILQLAVQSLIACTDVGVRIAVLDVQIAYEQDLLFHMIEDNDPVAEHEAYIIRSEIIYRMRRELLIVLKQIISEESDGTAGKRRHPVQLRTAVGAEQCFQFLNRFARQLFLLPADLDVDDILFPGYHQKRITADKRIPCPLNTAFYTFQQKRVGLTGKPLKQPDRRLHISKQPLHYRNQVIFPGQ
ncbi:hypothetical protein D3C75_675090 [compost metagenome]